MVSHDFDIIVIGAGVLGCFTARELCRYNVRVAVLEKNADICAEMTKANTAVVYAGYDTRPGTLKSRLTTRANRGMETLCAELGVPYSKCGSLLTASGPAAEKILSAKYEQGQANGVEGLQIISGDEARKREPGLSKSVTAALYSPSTGTLDPWTFGIAAAENAAANGAVFMTNRRAIGITYQRREQTYRITYQDERGGGELRAAAIINAAGLYADELLQTHCEPGLRIVPTKAEYLILDTYAAKSVRHILFQEGEDGKGITIVPTVSGNVLLGPSDTRSGEQKSDTETTADGLRYIEARAQEIMPGLPLGQRIRSFAGERPNVYYTSGENSAELDRSRSISELTILEDSNSPCLMTFAGIKTPGLTCAREIGAYVAQWIAGRLGGLAPNIGFNPRKKATVSSGENAAGAENSPLSRLPSAHNNNRRAEHTVVCRCRGVTEAQVRHAIRSLESPVSVNAVKRRAGAGLGRCQGGYCLQHIIEIIADECGIAAHEVRLEDKNSQIIMPPDTLTREIGAAHHSVSQHTLMTLPPTDTEAQVDVAIIGSGPAGLSAAKAARENGAQRVLIIERGAELGGLLGQCVHYGFGTRLLGREMTGPQYAAQLRDAASRSGAMAQTQTTVTAIHRAPDKITLTISSASSALQSIDAKALVFAAGCRERPIGHLPVIGTRPAGIFTAGTAQQLINLGGYTIGKKAVILGSGDVGLIMARQMKLAGMDVLCVAEQGKQCGGMPRNARECLDAFGIPLLTERTVSRVFGASRVEGVELSPAIGAETPTAKHQIISCDTLIISVGLIPERDLLHDLPPDNRIILCGNAHKILPLADDIAEDGAKAGRRAASLAYTSS